MHELALCNGWYDVIASFNRYLDFLWKEMSAYDPWESVRKFSDDVRSLPAADSPNTPISRPEQQEIQNTLDTISQILLEHVKGSAEGQKYIEEQFRILKGGLTKYGKKDYLMLLYTTVIGVGTTIGVTPETGSQVVGILNELLKHVPRILA